MKLRLFAFWGSLALLVHTHVTYPLSLLLLKRLRGGGDGGSGQGAHDPPDSDASTSPSRPDGNGAGLGDPGGLPRVSLIIAAFDEQEVIAAKLANALALDYPSDRLEIIVASDGSSDATVDVADAAGADQVLDLPRAGKLAAQNAATELAAGEIVAFSDANSHWESDALRELVRPFATADVGYVCGRVRFLDPEGDNEEGAYWRYEMKVRELESELGGITAGNGAIYAVRRSAYSFLPPSRSHDLSFPPELRKAGFRSLYVPAARAEEKMVPTIGGEFERKRRMMSGIWDIVVTDGMLDPVGYGPGYAYEIYSHRVLRYASPILHGAALLANLALLGRSRVYLLTLLAQLLIAVSGLIELPGRPFRLARYYVLVTAAIMLGTIDRLRDGPPAAWEKPEGTR